MKLISPTRVSIYDFMYNDTLPLTPLLADISHLSLPQAKRALTSGLQALLSALLSYQARYEGAAVLKKLFSRSGIKDLRQYNSMNFVTLSIALNYRQAVADAIFPDTRSLSAAVDYIAADIQADPEHVHILLTTLSVIFLRELAILADYAQLDSEDVGNWLQLQPQFLSPARFDPANNDPAIKLAYITHSKAENSHQINTQNNHTNNHQNNNANHHQANTASQINNQNDSLNNSLNHSLNNNTDKNDLTQHLNPEIAQDLAAMDAIIAPLPFDPYWYEITRYSPVPIVITESSEDGVPHYAKIIGRSIDNANQSLHDDLLAFGPMGAVSLPHQRWLLQLAKISDIYLSRQRLRIASEPKSPPSRPFVSLSMLGGSPTVTEETPSSTPMAPAKPRPLWKDPVILLIFLVIGVLGALAMLKYQSKQANLVQDSSVVVNSKDKPSEVAAEVTETTTKTDTATNKKDSAAK